MRKIGRFIQTHEHHKTLEVPFWLYYYGVEFKKTKICQNCTSITPNDKWERVKLTGKLLGTCMKTQMFKCISLYKMFN